MERRDLKTNLEPGKNFVADSNTIDLTFMISMNPLPSDPTVVVYNNEFIWGCT
jgi:hypothetical protein